jgi:hypothetical protein
MSDDHGLQPLSVDGLEILPSRTGDVLHLAMSGSIEMREPEGVLTPFWTALDAEAERSGVTRVEVDLRRVGFMNSSGIMTLVRWLMALKDRPSGGYRVLFRYDSNVTWQRTNLPVLAKLATDTVTISGSS